MISLLEYSTTSVKLERVDLLHLLDLIKASGAPDEPKILESLVPTREQDIYDLRPGPFVGRLGLPSGESLDIRSRFDFTDIVDLIRFSERSPLRIDALRVEVGEADLIIDLIALAFAREVERIVSRGLAKGYERRRFTRPPYPGTLDAAYWIGRQAGRGDRLATKAARLTTSIRVNQIVAAALDVLETVPLGATARARLSRVAPAFRGVSRMAVSSPDAASVTTTRLTSHYADAVALAERILRGAALSVGGAGLTGAGLLFAMPKVWESCVARWAEASWGIPFRTVAGYPFPVTSGGELSGIADVLVLKGDQPVALYDAKYKDIAKAPSAADVYQMVTYCERLGVASATLAYPTVRTPREYLVGARAVRTVGLRRVIDDLAESALREPQIAV